MKKDEAILQARKNFNDNISADVFISKYAVKDSDGNYLETSLSDMKNRLANEMVRIEHEHNTPKWYSKKNNPTFKNYMFLLDYFLFGGRTLYAMGNEYEKKASFSNCYVIPILDDSIEGIMDCAKEMSQTYRGGGGCGVDVSVLRADGMIVENGAKTTSGSVSFIHLFSTVTGVIGQNGRRGALMITIDVNHPDILQFIKLKGGDDLHVAENCNMSIKVTNDFMNLVADGKFDAEWKTTFTTHKGDKIEKNFTIGEIWNLFIHSTWKRAEPSLIFWDTMLNDDPSSVIPRFKATTTNPCGEIPLESYGACNLGSIVLSNLVINPFIKPQFDYETFKKVIKLSVRALDLIIDENIKRQPLPQQALTMKLGRRIGLGFTGYGDMLSMMNLTYGSDKAIEFTDSILLYFQREVLQSSIELAVEKGAFDEWYKLDVATKKSYINHPYFSVLSPEWKAQMNKVGIRNVGFTTVAPNGSLSIILGNVTSGIEPLFQRSYTRKSKIDGKDELFTVHHKLVEKWLNIFEKYTSYRDSCILKWYLNDIAEVPNSIITWLNTSYGNQSDDTIKGMIESGISESDTTILINVVKDYMLRTLFPQSDEISWEQRVRTQGIIQKHISHSISSTINLSSNVNEETVSKIYIEAYKNKLKGVTIYRDGCRGNILSKVEDTPKVKIQPIKTVKMNSSYNSKSLVIKSYENVDVDKIDDENYTKKWYVNLWLDEATKLPVAIFVNTNSKNKEKTILVQQTIDVLNKLAEKYIPQNIIDDNNSKIKNESNVDKLARVISMLLRHFTPISEILDEIEKLNPPLGSFIFHIKHALAEFIDNQISSECCSECGEPMYYEGGCKICKNCGNSKCG